MKNLKVLGISDERTTCEHCGKQHLKSTVVIQDTETKQIMHWGKTCALKVNSGLKNDIKTVQGQHDQTSRAKTFVQKYLSDGYTPDRIAEGLRNRIGGDFQYRDERFFYNGRIIIFLPRFK